MTRFSSSGVDEISNYLFKFPSGCMTTINTSFNLGMKRTAYIYGSKGYIEFPEFQFGEKFFLHTHEGTNEIKSTDGYSGESCHRFRLNPATFRTS
ncbi:MAG: hypothetical protein HN936_03655 [Bacteroidetes bacterium]|nr:hypothetical protein [Bacteroidota bacterium]